MAMQKDTRRFVNFLILVVGISAMVYLFYVRGVFAQLVEKQKEYAEEEKRMKSLYDPRLSPLEDISALYVAENKNLSDRMENAMREMSFRFSDYCEFPEEYEAKKRWGFWFYETHSRVRDEILRMCRPEGARPGIQFDDPQLGLGLEKSPADVPKDKALGMLRQLSIAETIIKLLVQAYRDQFAAEAGRKGSVFLQIVRVIPEEKVRTGAVKFRPNPTYDPTKPRSEKFVLQRYREFIEEYPVEITVVCDMNTLIRFLNSVRQKGRFLVIRKLDVLAPGITKSVEGATDYQSSVEIPIGQGKTKRVDLDMDVEKQERLRVMITAAGVSFLNVADDTSARPERTLRIRGAPPTPAGM